ncbi:MAG: tetratricopeptide repeat protein [Candidatus Hodarchaeales archaeon]
MIPLQKLEESDRNRIISEVLNYYFVNTTSEMDHTKTMNLALTHLRDKNIRHFGDLDNLRFIYENNKRRNFISEIKQLKFFDFTYFLAPMIFSKVISEEMVKENQKYIEAYKFQRCMLVLFQELYIRALDKQQAPSDAETEAEKEVAKVIWNYIQKGDLETIAKKVLKERYYNFLSKNTSAYLREFEVSSNLVNIVHNYTIAKSDPISIKIPGLLDLLHDSLIAGHYDQVQTSVKEIVLFIKILNSKEFLADFFAILGSWFRTKVNMIDFGIKYLVNALDYYNASNNLSKQAKIHSELASAYWSSGQYKKSLDHLASEIDIYERTKDELSILFTEERLSNFFYNLSRFLESQDWAMRNINSAIKLEEDDNKGYYLLESNLNYARVLIGLNHWKKAKEHLAFAERTIIHLKIPPDQSVFTKLEIYRLRGHIAVFQGKYNEARHFFDKKSNFDLKRLKHTPAYSRFLREEATLYRNLKEFSHAIEVLQPLFQDKDAINPFNIALLAELLALYSHERQALKLLNRAEVVLKNWNSAQGLSHIQLSKGYIHFLLQDFAKASDSYYAALKIGSSELLDLKVVVEANLNLAQINILKNNLKIAEHHINQAEQAAFMSGSLSFQYNTKITKMQLLLEQGNQVGAINSLRSLLSEAKKNQIMFIVNKAEFLLNEYA